MRQGGSVTHPRQSNDPIHEALQPTGPAQLPGEFLPKDERRCHQYRHANDVPGLHDSSLR